MAAGKRPVFKRTAASGTGHLGEEALLAYADDDDALGPAARAHLASCESCVKRAEQSQRMRRLLQATGEQVRTPPRDVARDALNRVRQRRAAMGHINEMFGVLAALLSGFSSFFSAESPKNDGGGERRRKNKRG